MSKSLLKYTLAVFFCLGLSTIQSAVAQDSGSKRWVPAKKADMASPYKRKVVRKQSKKTVGLRGRLQGRNTNAGSDVTVSEYVDMQPLYISAREYLNYESSLSENLAGRKLSQSESDALAVAKKFYQGLSTQNISLIRETLSDKTKFSDEAYPSLQGADVESMWHMVTSGDIKSLTYEIHNVIDDTVYGSWIADYEVLGNKIHNVIKSKIIVKDGKIATHRDDYDFLLWSKQAVPPLYYTLRPWGKVSTMNTFRLITTFALYRFKKGQKKNKK